RRRARTRRALGMATHRFHIGSRSLAQGALLTAAVGVLASVPLIARTLFPRLTSRIRKSFGRFVQSPPLTRLQIERADPTPGPDDERPARPGAPGRSGAVPAPGDGLRRRAPQHQQRGGHVLRPRPRPRVAPPGLRGRPGGHRTDPRPGRARAEPTVLLRPPV